MCKPPFHLFASGSFFLSFFALCVFFSFRFFFISHIEFFTFCFYLALFYFDVVRLAHKFGLGYWKA